MAILKKTVTVYQCERCEHEWIPRNVLVGEDVMPTVCPKCKSPYWDRPRTNPKPKSPKPKTAKQKRRKKASS